MIIRQVALTVEDKNGNVDVRRTNGHPLSISIKQGNDHVLLESVAEGRDLIEALTLLIEDMERAE